MTPSWITALFVSASLAAPVEGTAEGAGPSDQEHPAAAEDSAATAEDGSASPKTAEPDEAEGVAPFETALQVDASALGPSGDVVASRIEERCTGTLREQGILVGVDSGAGRIVVTIEPLPDAAVGYRTKIVLMEGGTMLPETESSAECRLCTEEELLDQVDASVTRVAAEARARKAEALRAERSTEPAPTAPPEDKPQERPRIGALGGAGVGVAVLGVVVTGVGVGLALRPPQRLEDEPTKRVNTRPPGLGLAISGSVVLVAGIAMLAADAGLRRRSRGSHARLRVTPTGSGVVFSGSF